MSGWQLCPATACHAPLMAELHSRAFPPQEAWDAAAFAALLQLAGSFGCITEAGFVLARAVADEAEILTLAVLPQLRRQGLGGALLGAAMREATARGAASLFLEVAESNHAARRLYTAAGAATLGRRPGYYASLGDALLLRIGLVMSSGG